MFKIGDFSKLSRVSVKTLRYYDKLGLLKPAHVDHFTGYRYYSADQPPQLNRILALDEGSQRVLVLAAQEARQHGHDYIGTEHMLLALASDADATVAAFWQHVGVATAQETRA